MKYYQADKYPVPIIPIHRGRVGITVLSSPERRCSSRTFRYGYLVTT